MADPNEHGTEPAVSSGGAEPVRESHELLSDEHLFHRLWNNAVGKEGYVKEEWKSMYTRTFVKGLKAERDAALAVVRAVFLESSKIHAAYKRLPETLRREVER